jgi:tetratricopeptide (TPR) repeat protein
MTTSTRYPVMKVPHDFATVLFGTAIVAALVQTQPVFAQSAAQVSATAQQVTVLIDGQNPGSGVIIRRDGTTYTVLTARHVVATKDEYEIVTPDGKRYKLNYATLKPLPGVDLATLEFTSSASYPVAKLGNSRSAPSGTTVYVAGFTAPTPAINQSIFNFTEGKLTANAERPLADGYALVYSNNTLPGMSGGPVLNGAGEVIGIHGRGDSDTTSAKVTANPNVALKTGFNLAIPINTFLSLAARTGVGGFTAPAAAPVSNQPTADDLYLQAANKLRNFDDRGAIADFDQVIRLNTNNAQAYRDRALARRNLNDNAGACADLDRSLQLNSQDGLAFSRRSNCRFELGNQSGALQDIEQAVRLSPNDARVYTNRGNLRNNLQNYRGAIADYDQAIRLDPNLASAYNNRGNVRNNLQDYRGAIADLDQALRLNPNYASAYNNRGNARSGLNDYRGAIADYNLAIRIDPNFALAYNNRGIARENSGDQPGAIADYQKAAQLAKAQGNRQVYDLAISNLRRLGR